MEKVLKNLLFSHSIWTIFFEVFKTYQEQFIFLCDHCFPRMVWSRLKLILSKVKIRMTKIFALGEEYEIGGRVKLKSDKIEKIFTWPIPQDQIANKDGANQRN